MEEVGVLEMGAVVPQQMAPFAGASVTATLPGELAAAEPDVVVAAEPEVVVAGEPDVVFPAVVAAYLISQH